MRERTIKKQFWVNQNEDDLLKQKSKKSGLSESEFLRSMIKGYKIKEQPTKEIREFINIFSGIGNNINQIAKQANIWMEVKDKDLEYIKNTIPKLIYDFQKKILSRN